MGVGSISIVAMDHVANLLSHADVVINTIPGLAADPIAEAFASAGIVTNGTLLDVVYDPARPSSCRPGGHAAAPPSAARRCCCTKP